MRKAGTAVGGQAHELMEDQGLYLAYGTTLIVVAITESYILYLQIGDGDILVVGDDGKSVEVPIPPDPSMVGNETASLCLPSAQNLFRSSFQNVGERLPDLIAVSTDGYSNSFADTPSFQKIGPDFLRLIRSHGIEHVRGEMGAWLDQVSERGSGDDITLGLLVRRGAPSDASRVADDRLRGPGANKEGLRAMSTLLAPGKVLRSGSGKATTNYQTLGQRAARARCTSRNGATPASSR
jgi:hypothetical protein